MRRSESNIMNVDSKNRKLPLPFSAQCRARGNCHFDILEGGRERSNVYTQNLGRNLLVPDGRPHRDGSLTDCGNLHRTGNNMVATRGLGDKILLPWQTFPDSFILGIICVTNSGDFFCKTQYPAISLRLILARVVGC
jgi:hypothetical protein